MLAPPESLLGMMQRGRGAAYLHALGAAAGQIQNDLMWCIEFDPRWDANLEARWEVWEPIAEIVRLDPDGVLEVLRRAEQDGDDPVGRYDFRGPPGWPNRRVYPFLAGGFTAERGDLRVVELWREIIAGGRLWRLALDSLNEIPEHRPEVASLLAERARDPAFAETLADESMPIWWEDEEWAELGRHPVLVEIRVEEERRREEWRRRPRPPAPPAPPAPSRADAVEALLRGGEDMRSAAKVLSANPDEPTHALARRWLGSPTYRLRLVGSEILAACARNEDRAALLDALDASVEADEVYVTCHLLEALTCSPHASAVPAAERAFRVTPYSWARRRAARLLAAADPGRFATGLAHEALWDADEEVRAVAAASVDPALPGVSERIAEICSEEGD